jgi:hypothetical protein
VHYRLRLIIIHLMHMLSRAKHRQSAAAGTHGRTTSGRLGPSRGYR